VIGVGDVLNNGNKKKKHPVFAGCYKSINQFLILDAKSNTKYCSVGDAWQVIYPSY